MTSETHPSKPFRISEMRAPEIEEVLALTSTMLLPVGNTEQHGDHLPTGVDTFTAESISMKVAEEVPCFIAPPINYGVAPHHMFRAGSFTIESQAFQDYVESICIGAAEWGIENIIMVNGHYRGHDSELTIVNRNLRQNHDIRAFHAPLHLAFKDAAQSIRDSAQQGHGSEFETSMMLSIKPELVDMHSAQDTPVPTSDGHDTSGETLPHYEYDSYDDSRFGFALTTDAMKNITDAGTIGDASLGTQEKGELLIKDATNKIVDLVAFLND